MSHTLTSREKFREYGKAKGRAARTDFMRLSTTKATRFMLTGRERITTVKDLCEQGEASISQIDANRESHILIEDLCNPGCWIPKWVAPNMGLPDDKKGNYLCDTMRGLLLLPPDTVIWWE